jgi:hypothetical protein
MKDNFEASLLSYGDTMKKGYIFLISNIGKVVALITLAVTALVLFTEISFADFTSEAFTSTLAVMITASYIMYFSLEDAGEKLGEESEEFQAAKKKHLASVEKIKGSELSSLRDFCKRYSEEELRYRKETFLIQSGYGSDEYEEFKSSGKAKDRKARRVFKKADRMKSVSISPKTLLAKTRARDSDELKNPEKGKLLRMLISVIPCVLSMTVTVSVVLSTKENMGVADVIDGILKLSGLPVIGFKGYSAGYNYTKNSMSLWTETKHRLLEAYLNGK